jgi:hypothetical protein
MNRDTVGKLATELLIKEPETKDPIELQREIQKNYEDQIVECINRGRNEFPHSFYVVVIHKKERLLPNVIRNYFAARLSCPTPEYDQVVYKYHRSENALEFLWVVPSQDTCQLLKDNALQIAPEEKDLLYFVLSFYDGTLLTKSKMLNGEKKDSPLLEN